MDENLSARTFFGVFPEKLNMEIYVIGFNYYVKAMTGLKTALLEEFPERKDEVDGRCNQMLLHVIAKHDEWYKKFSSYCGKNIFVVGRHVQVYDPDLDHVEENQKAHETGQNLQQRIMTLNSSNFELAEKARQLDAEIGKRKELLSKIGRAERQVGILHKALPLEQRMQALIQLPGNDVET